MLVGRSTERAAIAAVLDDARRGASRALVVSGGAGTGKTALLDAVPASAPDFRTLRVTGIEAELDVPYAGLHALCLPLLDLLGELPEPQAQALRSAFALEVGSTDRLAVGAGALSLLTTAAEQQPLLVVIDDVQWVDRETVAALLFTLRRAPADSLAFLFGERTGERDAFGELRVERVVVGSLGEDDAVALLAARWGEALAPTVARRVAVECHGHPLTMVEVAGLLEAGQRAGVVPLPSPLPVAGSVERSVRRRLAGLDDAVRDELLLLAVGAPPTLVDAARLEPAEAVGLVRLGPGGAAFGHPTFAPAVLAAVDDPAACRAAHLRVADALAGRDDLLHVRHRAEAATGPDDELADLLDQAGAEASARSLFSTAADLHARAAQLSVDDGRRIYRMLQAMSAASMAGDVKVAVSFADRVLGTDDDPVRRAHALRLRTALLEQHRHGDEELPEDDQLEAAATEMLELNPTLAAGLLGIVLQRCHHRLDPRGLEVARRRAAIDGVHESRRQRIVDDVVYPLVAFGEVAEATTLVDEALARWAEGEPLLRMFNLSEALLWHERYDELLEVLGETLKAASSPYLIGFELTNLALAEQRVGRWNEARSNAGRALDLAAEIDNVYLRGCNLGVLARLGAAQGDPDAERLAAEVVEIGRRMDNVLIEVEAAMAIAESALVHGDPTRAAAVLQPFAELRERNGVHEPSVLPFGGDLVEAYVAVGRIADARRELAALERDATSTGRVWAQAVAARCRGLLADGDAFAEEFERALALHDRSGHTTFQTGRTLLAYGGRLRRAGRRTEARRVLHQAFEVFDALDATPWAELASTEVAATGQRLRRRGPAVSEQLTPQELQVAMQVVEGRTNREVAQALFISAKTVEGHLTAIYRKLQVRSRAELVAQLLRNDHPDRIVADVS